jgi:uncharacterized protein (TIGR02300 family)
MRIVAKAELGTKRLCSNCGAKFYDLKKDPIHCPKCGTVHEVAPIVTRSRPEPAPVAPRPAPVEEVAIPEPAEVETVSLEEADAEAQGKKPATAEPGAEEEEVEIDETLDDDTFIEEQEEEDADVTDIIGGDIEPEEEG